MQACITSEIGKLKKVIVHSPGRELLAVTPSNRKDYLYGDIVDLQRALEEHKRFTSLLKLFTHVFQIHDLLEETLNIKEARDFLILRTEEVTGNKKLIQSLMECSSKELLKRYIEGWLLPPGPFSKKLATQEYILPPVPNLFYTRDASIVLSNSIIISAMRFNSRWPEKALMRTIFGFHPEFTDNKIIYDGSKELRHSCMIEGGDVHPLNPDVVLVGISERTSVAMLDKLTETLFSSTNFSEIIAVILPYNSNAIHLDMVWTHIDHNLCVAYPPFFDGPTRVPVLHKRKNSTTIQETTNLFTTLKNVGIIIEPIWSGGKNRETQEREQWASGCNFLAVAPGQVISYERNLHTLESLKKQGFKIIHGDDLLLGNVSIKDKERCVITFTGAELVRGGGGPRCMSLPLLRDEI